MVPEIAAVTGLPYRPRTLSQLRPANRGTQPTRALAARLRRLADEALTDRLAQLRARQRHGTSAVPHLGWSSDIAGRPDRDALRIPSRVPASVRLGPRAQRASFRSHGCEPRVAGAGATSRGGQLAARALFNGVPPRRILLASARSSSSPSPTEKQTLADRANRPFRCRASVFESLAAPPFFRRRIGLLLASVRGFVYSRHAFLQ